MLVAYCLANESIFKGRLSKTVKSVAVSYSIHHDLWLPLDVPSYKTMIHFAP